MRFCSGDRVGGDGVTIRRGVGASVDPSDVSSVEELVSIYGLVEGFVSVVLAVPKIELPITSLLFALGTIQIPKQLPVSQEKQNIICSASKT